MLSLWCSTWAVCGTVRVSHGAVVAHRYKLIQFLAPELCSTEGPLLHSVSLCNDLADILLDAVVLAGFENRANASLLAKSALSLLVFYCFSSSLLSVYRLVLWGWGLWTDRVYITLSIPAMHCQYLLIIITIIIQV